MSNMSQSFLSPSCSDPRSVAQIHSVLTRLGRVHVPGFFRSEKAETVFNACRDSQYKLSFKGQHTNYDLAERDVSALELSQKVGLLKMIHAQASADFQYLFDAYRLSDLAETGELAPGVLADFFAMLNSEETLDVFRAMTGDSRIQYVDAQLTRYRPGHFLTEHDDRHPEKHRLYAYVINLTPVWRVDWGGLLMFLAEDGHVAEAYAPRWNAINLFKVPQPHAVSVVAPFAQGARYSITGWLRAQKP